MPLSVTPFAAFLKATVLRGVWLTAGAGLPPPGLKPLPYAMVFSTRIGEVNVHAS